MATTKDFRQYALAPSHVDAAGKHVGRHIYWKLYAIENIVRVITHSILSVQSGPTWWQSAADAQIKGNVAWKKSDYANMPWHSTPGKHDIYYTTLSELVKIITNHSNLFTPLIPNINQWIVRLEEIRLPRNIVGHMNWLSKNDKNRIDLLHADLLQLIHKLSASGTALSIP